MDRWRVAQGGFPHGWESPFFTSNDPYAAINAYEGWTPQHMMIVAIFDDHGEGEPLDPHRVEEILDNEHEERHAS